MSVKRGDWVKVDGSDVIGFVNRVARNGSWADVNWHTHTKRMQTRHLVVQTTIPLGDGWTVTDMTREAKLQQGPHDE